MSLLDALLLDPVRIDYWLAVRTDSVAGTGMQNDPYNCSFIITAITSVTQITFSGPTATVTASGHGLQNNQRVLIWGVTGANAGLYNGVFTVTNVGGSSFQYVMTGTPSGNATNAGIQCRRNPFLFDEVMRTLPTTSPITVHLGPGKFWTLGYHENLSGGWQILNKMRIVGSGVDVTRVTVAALTAQAQNAYAFGHDLVTSAGTAPNLRDFVEIRELTTDCNADGLTPDSPTNRSVSSDVTAGAIRLMGNQSRAVRVKVSNWANTNNQLIGYGICMVIANTNASNSSANVTGVTNCGIEECIGMVSNGCLERYVVFHVGGKESPGTSPGNGTGPYIRNCFVDGADLVVPTVFDRKIQGVSMAWCAEGSIDNNQVINLMLGGPYMEEGSGNSANRGAYGIRVRGNTYRNVAIGLIWQLGAAGVPNAGVKKLLIEDNTIELAPDSGLTTIVVNGSNVGVYGIILDDKSAATAPYNTVLIRGNRIRYVDGAATGFGNGVWVMGATNLQVSENVLDSMPTNPLKNIRSANVSYFENSTPSGTLIRGYNQLTTGLYNELEVAAEEAMTLGFMQG